MTADLEDHAKKIGPLVGSVSPDNLANLDPLLRPSSIAIVGASHKPGRIGSEILANLQQGGFQGKLFPVHPSAEFLGSMKAYPTVLDIPDHVDLAVLVVPARTVSTVARQCGEKGVRGLVVISAGFREVGAAGESLEKELADVCHEYHMRMIGPNCLGINNSNPEVAMNATFAPGAPLPGAVGFLSQSGALGVAAWTEMRKRGLGISQFISIGNATDVTANDLLEYWKGDPGTSIIAMYLESFRDARRFLGLARATTRSKPVLVVKSGRTLAGSHAASSHTGALGGRDQAADALLRQTGVIRARSTSDLMDLIQAFSQCPVAQGKRTAILTNAGGPGILATDALIEHGLTVAELLPETRTELQRMLPAEASVANPVDMIAGASAEAFGTCLECLVLAEEVDLVLVAFVPPVMVNPTDVVEAVTNVTRLSNKPVLMVLMAEGHHYEEIPRRFPGSPPLYRYPETAAYVASELVKWSERRSTKRGNIPEFAAHRQAVRQILEQGEPGQYLEAEQAFRLIDAYGIPVTPWATGPTPSETLENSRGLTYPVAVKLVSAALVHKSDVGGVILDVPDTESLREALESLSQLAAAWQVEPRFLVQQMVFGEREVILGMTTDPVVGPLMLFGMGGKYVEVLRDVTLHVHPLTDSQATEMVKSIRGYDILRGVRGEEPVAFDALTDSLLRLSALITDFPQIAEMDLNPMRLGGRPEDCLVVDARIRLHQSPTASD